MVIARFIPEIEVITNLFSKKKLKISIITGNVKKCSEQMEQVQNNSDVLVFGGQIATTGIGITLTAASSREDKNSSSGIHRLRDDKL